MSSANMILDSFHTGRCKAINESVVTDTFSCCYLYTGDKCCADGKQQLPLYRACSLPERQLSTDPSRGYPQASHRALIAGKGRHIILGLCSSIRSSLHSGRTSAPVREVSNISSVDVTTIHFENF
jgi:hypothetical protein